MVIDIKNYSHSKTQNSNWLHAAIINMLCVQPNFSEVRITISQYETMAAILQRPFRKLFPEPKLLQFNSNHPESFPKWPNWH